MAKVIFVLQRKPGMTRQECSRTWAGDQHTSTVSKIPGLTRWVQNHVISAPGDPACDGIGELWFDSDEVMHSALASPQMAAAVEDARTFLDMDNTGLVIVEERPIMARGHDRAAGSPAPDKEMKIAYAKLADQLVDAWNSLDPQRVVDLLTEDHIYEDVTFAVVCRGAAETRGFFEGAYSAFPDIHFTLTSAATDTERAALEWTMTGTHQGDLPGLPATGKPFTIRGSTIFEIAVDKICAVRDYWDLATLLRQVGLMAEPATA
jgi:steroid delta-isomerase-like uncharacterized protein/uncharacterized protein (TIGR02118 family)